ncbi:MULTISPECIES: hypothetical protein [unclassified Thiocapsa]|uniref:hypothetical protein n=1 Tax=unclassified Thiocapsa TaxID=2641286 RepID=UPI0035B33C2E
MAIAVREHVQRADSGSALQRRRRGQQTLRERICKLWYRMSDRHQPGRSRWRLIARLEDGSMVIMGENAELAIDDFVYTEGESGAKGRSHVHWRWFRSENDRVGLRG